MRDEQCLHGMFRLMRPVDMRFVSHRNLCCQTPFPFRIF